MSTTKITHCAIHPGIGIGRVGNSPTEYFIGPEAPGAPADPLGSFKDGAGRIKRQAARFRIYGLDSKGHAVKELTGQDATITWTVHLANKKASWFVFEGYEAEQLRLSDKRPQDLRNKDVADRGSLEIDPGPRSISGANMAGEAYQFTGGQFLGVDVPLGELRTDGTGRLLVLGGFGTSESVVPDNPITEFANNDSWHDDVSDGPVTATVVLPDGTSLPVTPAWVVIAPPDYAPAIGGLVTLYDVAAEVAVSQGWRKAPASVSFTRDIYPVLARVAGLTWVNGSAMVGHRAGPRQSQADPFAEERGGDFLAPRRLEALADKSTKAKAARMEVFNRLRNPKPDSATAAKQQANFTFMPQLSGDGGFATPGYPETFFALLPSQYAMFARWANGDFDDDWTGAPPPPVALGSIPVADQPGALDQAALENGVGGPFFPGIEMTYVVRDPASYVGAFRLRPDFAPGDLGKRMAVPWQADFYECNTLWWPSQRPDDVITEAEYNAVMQSFADGETPDASQLAFDREAWARGVGDTIDFFGPARQVVEDNYTQGDNQLVTQWSGLGFVTARTTPDGGTVYVETDRAPYAGLKDRDYFHIMLNLDEYPDFLPIAKQLADRFLADAASLQQFPFLPDELRAFPYSERALDARLTTIYNRLVDEAETYTPDVDPVMTSRHNVVELIHQTSPFNQTDGAWLRNVAKAGPTDEVRSLLFSIWADEMGNGDPRLNHANLFTDLMRSVGFYPEPISTRAYSADPSLLDSAFTVPLLELVVSQFSDNYFPEILGMTLQLEWEVLDLRKAIKLLETYGLNAQFYKLHVGIDNAADGHGAKARKAVQLHLEQVRAESGEEAVQEQWARIWNGYVAFRMTGLFGLDLANLLDPERQPSLDQQVADMISRKAQYGRLNHDGKQIGSDLINDLFISPFAMMQALLASGLMVGGNPDESPFFRYLGPDGPMYKVFTEDEIKLWEDWARSKKEKPDVPDNSDAAAQMVRLIKTLAVRQEGTPGHAASQLGGKPVAAWFHAPVTDFMRALADPANGFVTPGDAGASRFITDFASGSRPMAAVFGEVAPGTAHTTWRSIAANWINAGCPIPSATFAAAVPPRRHMAQTTSLVATATEPVSRLMLQANAVTVNGRPMPEFVLGMGLVH